MGEAAANLDGEHGIAVVTAFKPFEHFSKCLLDAYVVVDTAGRVHKCNAMFSQLVGLKTKQILKSSSFDDVLQLSVAGSPLRVSDIISKAGATRIDEVTGNAGERQNLNLIIGAYPLVQDSVPVGAFILLRDVTAEASLQDKYKDKATQSITDSLTGLFNRAYFTEYLGSQLQTLESFPETAPQRHLSVVILDIDFFKKINDGFGHQAGDFVLRTTAEIMKRSFRKTDVVARYGGEEFLAILPGTDIAGAATAAEKLRIAMQDYKFVFGGKLIPVTISSGVAQIAIGKETGEQGISRADTALYSSKQNGRNRVSIHDGTIKPVLKLTP